MKWETLLKSNDGTWKACIIFGRRVKEIMAELNNGDTFTVIQNMMYPWREGYENKK